MKQLQKAMTKLTAAVMVVMLLSLLLMVIDVGGSSSSCPEEEEYMDLEKVVHFSDLVVLGKVIRRLPDKGASMQLYKVEMRVFCVYKGQNVPWRLNISAAGNLSDPCPDHQMEVGRLYMAYLYKHDHAVFIPAFPHHPDTYKYEMFVLCDLNISRPVAPMEPGEPEVKCEDDKPDYENDNEEPCIAYTPKPGESAHGGKKAPNQPGKIEKVEGDSDGVDANGGSGRVTTSVCLSSALALLATVCLLLL